MTADVTRSNYSANSILTSTALNADFNQILTRINDFPADKLTDATVTKDKLATGATANLTIATKTTTATILTTEEIVFLDTSGGAYTVTLPTAVGNSGLTLFLKKTTSDTNAVTIDPNGSETIDGVATFPLGYQYAYIKIVSDGANWSILEMSDYTEKAIWNTYNSYGSTNTKIPNFTTEQESSFSLLATLVRNSATLGNSVTALRRCRVNFVCIAAISGVTDQLGLSKNSSALTTNIANITDSTRIAYDIPASASQVTDVSWTGILEVGDVVRVHTAAATLISPVVTIEATWV